MLSLTWSVLTRLIYLTLLCYICVERKEEELGPAEEEEEEDRREKKVREEEESWRSGDRPPQDRGVTAGADTACCCGQLKMN